MTSEPITLGQLESHLWEAANILRGPVDAADFKTYVFPLLFFKRISDVHDEEYATALAESGGDEEYAVFPQNYRFQIPEGRYAWMGLGPGSSNGTSTHFEAASTLHVGGPPPDVLRAPGVAHMRAT